MDRQIDRYRAGEEEFDQGPHRRHIIKKSAQKVDVRKIIIKKEKMGENNR